MEEGQKYAEASILQGLIKEMMSAIAVYDRRYWNRLTTDYFKFSKLWSDVFAVDWISFFSKKSQLAII